MRTTKSWTEENNAWEYWGYDIKNTRNTPFFGPETNSLAWQQRITGDCNYLTSIPILSNGLIFLQDDMGKLYALDKKNPKFTKWSYQLDTVAYIRSSAAPCVYRDVVYAVSDKRIIALDTKDGTIKNAYDFNDSVSAFSVNSNRLYVTTYDGTFYATEIDSRKIAWQFRTVENVIQSYPAIDLNSSTIYFRGSGTLYALYLTDGSLKWAYTISDPMIYYETLSSPVIADDGTIFVGEQALFAINPDGSLKWKLDLDHISASPALQGAYLYVGDQSGKFYSISLKDGAIRWQYQTQGSIDTPAVAMPNEICVLSSDHNIYAFSPDGNLKWVYQMWLLDYQEPWQPMFSPVSGKNELYISVDNYLYVIGPNDKAN